MLSIVFGLIAICLGLWGLSNYWWYIVDVFVGILPLFLIFGGFIAVLAGIRNTGLTAKMKDSNVNKTEARQADEADEVGT
ncbi:magnetosome protein MamI [Candidatus Magnetobacterium bavaricum]|uniref:Magnetosome protein MamI n=1 Tax=Candidatus Magnetobacterium bavaricum TaxID=29290 RepID=A0A0F3GLG6_9BACT|nr:magnetosome protein MamI [Candidatus Magnetobacterium bavaricum]KJU84844.1 magnetosome protein MamI [Candidatus Magnetobacterium bavaricum]